MLKATLGGVPVHIWFTPSFNIKTTDKRVEQMMRTVELESFDPWEMRMRKVKATKSLRDAYLVLEEYRVRIPELEVEFQERPELESITEEGVTH